METAQTATTLPTSEPGLSLSMQRALYATIAPKLALCRQFLHYGLAHQSAALAPSLIEGLAGLEEMEQAYLAGSEQDLHRLVAIITLMDSDLDKMQAALIRAERPSGANQMLMVLRTTTTTTTTTAYAAQTRSKSLSDTLFGWLF